MAPESCLPIPSREFSTQTISRIFDTNSLLYGVIMASAHNSNAYPFAFSSDTLQVTSEQPPKSTICCGAYKRWQELPRSVLSPMHQNLNDNHDSLEILCREHEEHPLSSTGMPSIFDSIFLLTIYPTCEHERKKRKEREMSQVIPVPTFPSSSSVRSCESSECPIRKIYNGVPKSNLDPATLPPPRLHMRTRRSRAAA